LRIGRGVWGHRSKVGFSDIVDVVAVGAFDLSGLLRSEKTIEYDNKLIRGVKIEARRCVGGCVKIMEF